MSIITEIKQSFQRGDSLIKLIYINASVFLLVKLVELVSFFSRSDLSTSLIRFFMCPAHLGDLITQPWSIFTYMFLHQGFFHVLFNLLWLYWIGIIFIDFLNGTRLIAVYLFGGLSGALLYILAYNTVPFFSPELSFMLGASASVMAIVLAITMYAPDFTLYLVFLGPVKLKWIALASVVLDVLLLTDGNAGGHIAHLGGAMFGIYWGYRLKNGTDILKWSYVAAGLFKPRSKVKLHYKNETQRRSTKTSRPSSAHLATSDVDAILDKISRSGYESLSASEKEKLFNASKGK